VARADPAGKQKKVRKGGGKRYRKGEKKGVQSRVGTLTPYGPPLPPPDFLRAKKGIEDTVIPKGEREEERKPLIALAGPLHLILTSGGCIGQPRRKTEKKKTGKM